ncbi:glycoside hydrolase family 26 protein [Benzoatithermus flavus]|uniref:Glycosyl hydrolase n=1 Tax=Benzoatithermus flavus TaxID=3108223 RepID=A0ABU8XT04_9PROT
MVMEPGTVGIAILAAKAGMSGGSEDSASLEPVASCTEFEGGAVCLDVALPGGGAERLASAGETPSPAAAAPAAEKVTWGGRRSGLPWMSGASSAGADFEAWRGRRLDVKTAFLAIRYGWAELTQTSFIRPIVRAGYTPVIAAGMLPESARGQFVACANGAFDDHIRKIGRSLVAMGAGNAILRLGWEANRMGDFPWGVLGDGSGYKNCFRRWVQVLRSVTGQAFTFDFNMGARGNLPYSQDNIYPGAEYVDVIGTQRYDRCPAIRSDADWQAAYDVRQETGNPVGLGAWLAWAKAKGKRFSVPEWGVSDHHPSLHCPDNGFDNPFFIQKMFEFFRANAAVMAYESYFNGGGRAFPDGVYKIFPAYNNPRAAARYQQLWSAGR